MKIIGLVGGVASGKSLIAQQFQRLGAKVLDADGAGHEVLHERDVVRRLREHWGDAVIDADGRIDRSAVARIVFAPPDGPRELAFLEQISHPRIERKLKEQIAVWRRQGVPAVILDAAVMFKGGWHRLCDTILFVEANTQQRLERAARRGWTDADFHARERAQESLAFKRGQADRVIDNSGSPDRTFAQVRRIWTEITSP